ncbi:hypothetical protein PYJP_04320 [Pyrofollis japonicus]|uniref:hypothetical protein n=1 Tax=Pyrofollis japonicus TaxID=3060460 RepID=UPI00295B679E|nr:hypothetical protein [Pyrofollis japonicus]BEP17080.1 hypothetical protein PYJP_04320 [Pyrofollis japonicus]
MPHRWFTEDTLVKFVKRLRERWPELEITRLEQRVNKQVLYIRLRGGFVKLIVYRDGRIRAYGKPDGLTLAIKNIAARVLESWRA